MLLAHFCNKIPDRTDVQQRRLVSVCITVRPINYSAAIHSALVMTAETLKPFLNLPNATANDLKAHCAQKSAVKRGLCALGCILAAVLCCALIGVQIWHLNKTAALQREVDDLKQLLDLRARDFNDYEFENELFDSPEEYAYDMSEDRGHREPETSEMLDSGLTSSGMHGEDEEEDGQLENEDEETEHNLGIEDLIEATEDDDDDDEGIDDDINFDESVDMTVAVAGKRRARSISGVTRQGVPIVDEPYVPRRNRSRQPHRIFEQMRQRPEESVTPPTTGEMFRWDVQNHKSHTTSLQQQSYGSISIRPYHHMREYQSTTPIPVPYGSHSGVRHQSRNQLNAGNPTKPPAQMLNRMSRVQSTGGENEREKTQIFPKVVSNPGTSKEKVRESIVRQRYRKAGSTRAMADSVATAVHLVKHNPSLVHRNTRHRDWMAKGSASRQTIASGMFSFDGEQLVIRDPGLYYIYAQVTYDNVHSMNGFKVIIDGEKHMSCTVHAQGENTNTCFTAAISEIENPDTKLHVEDVDHSRNHIMSPEKTFFGVFKIGRMPQSNGNVRTRMQRKMG